MIKETTNNLNYNKGITLIALVITIIVLLILAGVAISMLTGDNGILKQAVKAKEETEKKSMQENIQLAVLSAMSSTNHELTLDNLKAEVKSQLGSDVLIEQDAIGGYVIGKKKKEDDTYITDVYGVVDKEGKVGEGKWYFIKPTEASKEVEITDGNIKLTVGNAIDYSPIRKENGEDLTEEELKDSKYTSEVSGLTDNEILYGGTYIYKAEEYAKETDTWGVLGVEDGKVIIAPMYSIIPSLTRNMEAQSNPNPTTIRFQGKNGYQYGVKALNDISKIYGYGKGAESARSITVEDVNKVTGYNPNYVGQNVNKMEKESLKEDKYEKNYIWGYGKKVTYTLSRTDKTIHYNDYSGVDKLSSYSTFEYLKGNKWVSLEEGETVTFVGTGYEYYPETLKNSEDSTKDVGIGNSEGKYGKKAYDMLFKNTSNEPNKKGETENENQGNYWLGSSRITTEKCVNFGMFYIKEGYVRTISTFASMGETGGPRYGVRPAVTLRSDVEITEEGGTYKIN